jgi:hypothetical protein
MHNYSILLKHNQAKTYAGSLFNIYSNKTALQSFAADIEIDTRK